MGAEGGEKWAPKAVPSGRRRRCQMGAVPPEGERNPAEGGYFASYLKMCITFFSKLTFINFIIFSSNLIPDIIERNPAEGGYFASYLKMCITFFSKLTFINFIIFLSNLIPDIIIQ